MTARSFSMPTILPLTTLPSNRSSLARLSASRAANRRARGSFLSRCGLRHAVMKLLNGCDGPRVRPVVRCEMRPKPSATTAVSGQSPAGGVCWIGCRCDGPRPANRIGARVPGALLADLPLDQSDSGVECRLYIQVRGIEQVGVGRRPHGGAAARRHRGRRGCLMIGQNGLVGHAPRRGPGARESGAGAHFGPRGDENLDVRVGADDGADVAAVEHGAAGLARRRPAGSRAGPRAPRGSRRRWRPLRPRRGARRAGSSSVAGSRLRAAATAAHASSSLKPRAATSRATAR